MARRRGRTRTRSSGRRRRSSSSSSRRMGMEEYKRITIEAFVTSSFRLTRVRSEVFQCLTKRERAAYQVNNSSFLLLLLLLLSHCFTNLFLFLLVFFLLWIGCCDWINETSRAIWFLFRHISCVLHPPPPLPPGGKYKKQHNQSCIGVARRSDRRWTKTHPESKAVN